MSPALQGGAGTQGQEAAPREERREERHGLQWGRGRPGHRRGRRRTVNPGGRGGGAPHTEEQDSETGGGAGAGGGRSSSGRLCGGRARGPGEGGEDAAAAPPEAAAPGEAGGGGAPPGAGGQPGVQRTEAEGVRAPRQAGVPAGPEVPGEEEEEEEDLQGLRGRRCVAHTGVGRVDAGGFALNNGQKETLYVFNSVFDQMFFQLIGVRPSSSWFCKMLRKFC